MSEVSKGDGNRLTNLPVLAVKVLISEHANAELGGGEVLAPASRSVSFDLDHRASEVNSLLVQTLLADLRTREVRSALLILPNLDGRSSGVAVDVKRSGSALNARLERETSDSLLDQKLPLLLVGDGELVGRLAFLLQIGDETAMLAEQLVVPDDTRSFVELRLARPGQPLLQEGCKRRTVSLGSENARRANSQRGTR